MTQRLRALLSLLLPVVWSVLSCGGASDTSKLPIPQQSAGASGARFYRDHIYVRADPRDEDQLARIWSLADEVVSPHDPALVTHDLVVTRYTLARLRAAGVPVREQALDVQSWVEASVQRALQPSAPLTPAALGLYGPWFSKVQDLEAITTYLRELAQVSNGRARVMPIGRSVEGRDILALHIAAGPAAADRPGVVVLGAQHAREWASTVVAMGLVDGLVRQYDADARVRRAVDNLDIYIVPVSNPDGYVATFNGRRLQRKNMQPGCNVDLNRNYDAAFGMGVGGQCASETYPGRAAFSEPESRAVRDLVASLRRPRLLIDYHSAAAQVMIPYAYTRTPPPNFEVNRALCQLYSSALREVNGTNYPATPGYNLGRGAGGGAFDWFRMKHGEAIVVELGGNGFDIPANRIVPFAEENFVAWLAVAGALLPAGVADAGAPPEPVDAAADAPVSPPPPPGSPGPPAPVADAGSAPVTPEADAAVGDGPPGLPPSGSPDPAPEPVAPGAGPPAASNNLIGGCAIAGRGAGGGGALAALAGLALLVAARRRRRPYFA